MTKKQTEHHRTFNEVGKSVTERKKIKAKDWKNSRKQQIVEET